MNTQRAPASAVTITILGEPASKANSRILATNKATGRPMFIKSAKARGYARDLKKQVRVLPELLDGDLAMTITIYYASRRPDLDPSIILDGLQGLIYGNDRQVKEMHLYHAIDRDNPRAEVEIWPRSGIEAA